MPIEFSQFKVRQGTLELRYSPAFLLWDRAGTIWQELHKRYPELRANVTQPSQQVMKVDNSSDAALQINTCNVTTAYPPTGFENFKLLAARFFQIVIATLEIETLERIGLRIIFERQFATREEAADFAFNLTKYRPGKSKYLGIDGRAVDFDYAIRWEGEARGCMARIKTAQFKLDVEIPAGFEGVNSVHKEITIVNIDVDYYTLLQTHVGKFDGPTLIDDWYRLIRRDVPELLHD